MLKHHTANLLLHFVLHWQLNAAIRVVIRRPMLRQCCASAAPVLRHLELAKSQPPVDHGSTVSTAAQNQLVFGWLRLECQVTDDPAYITMQYSRYYTSCCPTLTCRRYLKASGLMPAAVDCRRLTADGALSLSMCPLA